MENEGPDKPKPTRRHRNAPDRHKKAGSSARAANLRRLLFVQAYLANGLNGTRAAIAAGFSAKSADFTATQLLKEPEVAKMIAAGAEKAVAVAGLSVERTLLEVARIAYADPKHLYRTDGSLIPIAELSDDVRATVASVEVDVIRTGSRIVGETTKLKLWNKVDALQMAMKYFGLFERDNTQRAQNINVQIALIGPP